MRVEIQAFPDEEGIVRFVCSEGSGVGRWAGDRRAALGACHVEVDVTTPIPWSSFEPLDDDTSAKIALSPTACSRLDLSGRLLEVDLHGVVSLEIGESVLRLDTLGESRIELVGQTVRVSGVCIELWPMNL